ncbi:DNA-directed RNA polymerase III subunit RPC4-like isoform X1 [Rhodnius prolixus]
MPGDSEQPITIKTEIPVFKRLPSFRTPRDLKLSEFRDIRPALLNENRNKRVFVPNLNVQRKKQTDGKDGTFSNNDNPKQNQKEHGRKEDRGRGRGRGNKRQVNFIQGTGVFSEGLAPTLKHWHNRHSSGEASTSIPKPKLNLKDNAKINKEKEEEVMKELLRDDLIEDPDIQPDLHHCPVRLPLQDCKDFITKFEVEEMQPKEDNFQKNLIGIKVKREPETFEMADTNGLAEDVTKPLSLTTMRPFTIPQLLSKSSEKSFLFFQIPSCLPNMKVNMESVAQNPCKKDDQKNEEENSKNCVLRNLPPGRIGKLQILKSGKARLILGDVKLWVEPGTQTAFKQDLISVNLDPNQKTGNMINMGDLTTRMVITPDWESLLLKPSAG